MATRRKGAPMGSEQNEQASEQETTGGKEHVLKRAFRRRNNDEGQDAQQPKTGKAHIPSTVMTVEYLDDSEGVDDAIQSLSNRMSKIEERLQNLEQAHTEMVSVINRQAKEIRDLAEALTRRMDHLYQAVSVEDLDVEDAGESLEEGPRGLPDELADDEYHQQAFRVARVLVADLEAYYPSKVREGALYGNIEDVLSEELAEVRETYEERVPEKVRDEFDHLSAALKGLTSRVKQELDEEK